MGWRSAYATAATVGGRWKVAAERLIDRGCADYGAQSASAAERRTWHELKLLLLQSEVSGFDVSQHGLADAPEAIKPFLFRYRAQDKYPFGDNQFDLVISLGCLHNLRVFELQTAVSEIERVGKQKYIMLESYRSELELFNLECWALTCESFFDTAEWIWLYQHYGFTGDYEFIYFE